MVEEEEEKKEEEEEKEEKEEGRWRCSRRRRRWSRRWGTDVRGRYRGRNTPPHRLPGAHRSEREIFWGDLYNVQTKYFSQFIFLQKLKKKNQFLFPSLRIIYEKLV